MENDDVKIIAFYLPQFHAIPENDSWWGKGFTEWDLVKKAKPLFEGHNQPLIPSEKIGYYDMSDINVLRNQAKLAKEHGVNGFCFYHYLFGNKLLLEKPLEMFLEDKSIEIDFCLCWANEGWSKKFSGESDKMLISCEFGDETLWEEHLDYLGKFFDDSRYIKVNGKPLIIFYRNDQPKINEMINFWKSKRDIFVTFVLSGYVGFDQVGKIDLSCFDAVVEFAPGFSRVLKGPIKSIGDNHVYDYDDIWESILKTPNYFHKQFLGAFPSWDNTARRSKGGAVIVLGSTPQKFSTYLAIQIARVRANLAVGERFVFVNAWNEWGEGAYLEPDTKNGFAYLDAVKKAREMKINFVD